MIFDYFNYICDMVIALIFIGIGILIFASYYWIKFVWFVFTPKKEVEKVANPYIEAQKTIIENDRNYDEYLDWLKQNGDGVPIDKLKHQKEIDIENEYKKYI